MKTYKFLVPIYIEIDDTKYDPTSSLCGRLQGMEDFGGPNIFVDTAEMKEGFMVKTTLSQLRGEDQ